MSIFTDENAVLFNARKAYYEEKYLSLLEPYLTRFPIFFRFIYVFGQIVFFVIPLIVVLHYSIKSTWRWKHFLLYCATLIPAGWAWNFYCTSIKQAWIFPPQYFLGLEIKGMILEDFTFYIFGVPTFYAFYHYYRDRFKNKADSIWERHERALGIAWFILLVILVILGAIFFKTAGHTMIVFMYIPTLLLILYFRFKIFFPQIIWMVMTGINLEYPWDYMACKYGLWIYINGFVGYQLNGVPIEMLYFSFASGTFSVLFYELYWKLLYGSTEATGDVVTESPVNEPAA